MDRIHLGFVVAAVYNLGIIPFSRGFTDVLGQVDPLFGSGGCVGIVLWGMAYFALRNRYAQAPAVAAVFCIEKLFYTANWAVWMASHSDELTAMRDTDPLSAMFFGTYGVGDALFMVFFGWVAFKHRDSLTGSA